MAPRSHSNTYRLMKEKLLTFKLKEDTKHVVNGGSEHARPDFSMQSSTYFLPNCFQIKGYI